MFAHLQVVQLYFEDSGSKLDKLAAKLSGNCGAANGGNGGIDYNDVDQLVHQFKGSSASFGAQSIAAACVRLREACLAHDPGTCLALLQHIQQQFQASVLSVCWVCHPSTICAHGACAAIVCTPLSCLENLPQSDLCYPQILRTKLDAFMQLEIQRKQLLSAGQ
jgi:HPt (histidine-containing phosphotransfer) domain-containing protein